MAYSPIPDNIAAALNEFIEQAQRLGITWSLRAATVIGTATMIQPATSARIVLDGDNERIAATSMIGPLQGTTRVFVLFVPPAGSYVIGRLDIGTLAQVFKNILITGTIEATNPNMRRRFDQEGTNQTGYTDTTFTLGTQTCGTTFVAPPSGNGVVHWHAGHSANTADKAYVSMRLGTGSILGGGAEIMAPSLDYAVVCGPSDETGAAMFRYATGLIPGATYNIVTMHRVSAGNGTVFNRTIMWEPEF